MEKEGIAEKRVSRVKAWLKNPYNLSLIIILAIALIIRLYHFSISLGQPLWWDEAEYMAAANHFAFGTPYDLNPQRPPVFQFIASLFLSAGASEATIKFFLVLIPSVFLIWAVYLVGKEMFNKKVGLIGALLTAVSWSLLFWTSRVQPDYISMSFQMLAIFFMWKYWKERKTFPILLAGAFSALSFHFKVSGLLVPLIFGIFSLMRDRLSAFKKKEYYLFVLAFLIFLSPLFIWNFSQYGNILATSTNYSPIFENDAPFQVLQNLFFYKMLTENVLFIIFILGLILSLKFVLYLDVIAKQKEKTFNPHIFAVLLFIVVSLFYIFWIKETQDRWVFLWIPFISFIAAEGFLFIHAVIKKYNKPIAAIVLAFLLIFVCYTHYTHATDLVIGKKDTYVQIVQSGTWIKENSNSDDIVFSRSQPQHSYYTQRKVINYKPAELSSASDFEVLVNQYHPRFLVVSTFEAHPTWISGWLEDNSDRLTPVQGYQLNGAPVVLIYEISY